MHAHSHTPMHIRSLVTRPRSGAVRKTHESNIGMEKKKVKAQTRRAESRKTAYGACSVPKTEEFPL